MAPLCSLRYLMRAQNTLRVVENHSLGKASFGRRIRKPDRTLLSYALSTPRRGPHLASFEWLKTALFHKWRTVGALLAAPSKLQPLVTDVTQDFSSQCR